MDMQQGNEGGRTHYLLAPLLWRNDTALSPHHNEEWNDILVRHSDQVSENSVPSSPGGYPNLLSIAGCGKHGRKEELKKSTLISTPIRVGNININKPASSTPNTINNTISSTIGSATDSNGTTLYMAGPAGGDQNRTRSF